MPLQLDHTIVPAYDKVKSAEFIARMFGLKYQGPWGHFAPVKVNDILTLDFDDSDNLSLQPLRLPGLGRGVRLRDPAAEVITDEGVVFGSGPRLGGRTGRSTTWHQGRGFTSSARTGMCGRLLRTRMLRRDGGFDGKRSEGKWGFSERR